tara:strand:- start:895 stop:1371 length:477 start_codon:yes stop_codon:yes gene_type:complete
MATSGIVRFATREPGVSFSEHPNNWHAQFYVHYDCNVESIGLDIANSIVNRQVIDEWEIDNLDAWHNDAYYCYYIWQARGKDTWISIFRINQSFECEHCDKYKDIPDKCIFVGKPEDLQRKINNLGDFEVFDDNLKSKAIDHNWNGDKIKCVDVENTN